jgi:20S proteasome subunit beta 6
MTPSGHGALYHYDAIGSKERVSASCTGKGDKMIQPLLDELSGMEEDGSLWELSHEGTEFLSKKDPFIDINVGDATALVIRTFKAAAEREISVGDGVQLWILKRKADHEYTIEKSFYSLPMH